jgi:hypothetical protein
LTRAGPSTCDGVVSRGALLMGLLSCARASAHPHGDRSSLWCGRTTASWAASTTTTEATSEAGRIQGFQSSAGSMRLRGGSAWWGRSYPWESVVPSASHNVTDYYGVLEMHHDAPVSEVSPSRLGLFACSASRMSTPCVHNFFFARRTRIRRLRRAPVHGQLEMHLLSLMMRPRQSLCACVILVLLDRLSSSCSATKPKVLHMSRTSGLGGRESEDVNRMLN